ncbi:ABC transporter permease [Hufsiella ginkgonis]|uniref:FtsX-like permease family protein n=1 Tax=Hufsiella ginkgonis TaxID=2695274 RepID=A0A7K1XV18_9SPHI|nr:ABC transporter permease [Hufsiella ginkgonis]MXV14851.1 FtsX-like permease family protein [Hufsiella ginkgonis]
MLINYIKIGWRNFTRHRSFAAINVVGLASGIACCILIFTLISFHLSFDTFHTRKDRIYRLVTQWHDDGIGYSPAVPQPLGKAFREDFDFAEKTARIVDYQNILISVKNGGELKKFSERWGIAYTEPAYFDIFDFPLLKGDRATMLKEPGTALVTEKLAKKYFGDKNPMNQVIRVDNRFDYKITGVLRDIPENTDLRQEIYLSYINLKDWNPWIAGNDSWGGVYSGCKAYALLKPNVNSKKVAAAMPLISKKYFKGRDQKIWRFALQPVADMHFNPDYDGYADTKYLWALFFIGVFLIVTASVNFINLATAQALNRSREVGIRKVLGSLQSQVFWQFIAETAIITASAIVLAVAISAVGLPWLNNLFESEMSLHLFSNGPLLAFLVLLGVVVTFLSGSYPGLVLARFQPVLALKSKLSQRHIGGFSLRRILVVAQFSISQMMIIGTLVIAGQIRYSRTSDLGFNKDAVVMLPLPDNDKVKMTALRSRLQELPGVQNLSLCWQAPAASSNNTTGLIYENRAEEEHWSVNTKNADDQYLKTFGLTLVAGRNLYPADTAREFLVNETFVKKLGLKSPKEVIGKLLTVNRTVKAPIVGVVKDFYNYSFRSEISAVCISSDWGNYGNCAVKIDMRSAKTTLPAFQKIWNETYPDYLYEYQFLDDSIAGFYRMDNIMLKLTQAFAGIAVLIGSLGLYGLISFMAVRKTKEIGLRKVLGATIPGILWIFGKEFSRLLVIAFLIAAPLAWWAMRKYLEEFQYKMGIGPGIFLLAIGGTFAIAAVTIGYRSIKAALANPVKSLRTE